MSFAAYKMMHLPTGIENCASGFITHCRADLAPQIPSMQSDDIESEWPAKRGIGSVPNLIVTAGNVLEVYVVRVEEEGTRESRNSREPKRGGVMDGVSGASLELVCHYRLHGNVESMAVLPIESGDGSRRRDSIILAFKDAKISVLEFDDSIHGLRTSSMHCFEGPDWLHLKEMIILKAAQAVSGLVGDDDALGSGGAISARIQSSYIINLRDLDMKHVKDFIFVHDYIEPVVVILHERELTWAGRVSWKHHTCMIAALSISTTLKQPTLIWSVVSATCALALNNYAVSVDSSQELPRASFSVELDAAKAAWLLNDVALLSTKNGELLLLTLVYDGRVVQRLDLSKSKASVLTSDITTIGSSLFFLASRLGDSLLVQFTYGLGSSLVSSGLKEEVGDIEGDVPTTKRLKRSPSDGLQDMKNFSFSVRDSLINVGPLKDFSYGLRINADANATGMAKQSNYELVCCSGHGKNGALCVLRQSIRPEMITEVDLPGCRGIWTVYHKNARGHNVDTSRMAAVDDEYHAYLIISMEARTMVLETADHLTEVTESVDYFVQGRTIAAGNLFGRRRVVQVFERGARILDGSFMTQNLSFGSSNSESGSGSESSTVLSVSIADPYVLIRMTDGSIRLLIGDPSTCMVSTNTPSAFENSRKSVSACTLYHDKGPEPWLRKASTDAWLSTGISEAIDGADGGPHDQGDIYCIVCYETGALEIFDVPNFNSVFSVDKFCLEKPILLIPMCGNQPQIHWLCDGSIVAFTVLHNVNCNHGLIYVTSQGNLKICQLPSVTSYDNYWPVQKVPLKGTPHQVTYFAEKNLYPLIVSVPVQKPVNQVLSSLVDQEVGHQIENHNLSPDELHQTYNVEEFEVRILEPERPGGPWQTKATIPMQSSENALTVRVVTLFNTTTKENETLLAIGTAYLQGEDVAARGRVLLFSVVKNPDNSQVLVSEVYSKELKGAISALASLQGHLLIASGPKIILHKWTGTELNGVAFYDAPPLYVVSLNIVKNFILLGDIHKSIYFLSWKEQGAQLSLLAKDFGSLDCFATEFLIDGSTLSLVVSDEQKNIQIFYYAPKMSESWKGQKLLSRAEFHVGAHVTKFIRLQMLSTSDRSGTAPGSDKTNRFALLFITLDGSIGCLAPLDELTFRRLQSLQKKLIDAVPHVAGLNPRSFRQFQADGRVHRPGPESIVDCELLSHYEMLPLEEQLEIAQQVGTTRAQILSNLNDLSLGTSFL
ncbi:hypothetical protein GH714_026561 [Hevea brasiliensis]|uniref:Cleavage/polyadenylation specificity factor A subunit C-terminal domain-containing protein n=1 Tax=Hevea brasiliensis TaxID=3981 RepID=A0A6A6MDC7_HEVBR|nr:hypothetical protein GH714_026561 [Hevea brasiliensis]